MTTFRFGAASLTLRRVVPAALLVACGALASTALAPATAGAELDVGYYDQCLDDVNQRFREGDFPVEYAENEYRFCCYAAGGRWVPGEFFGDCGAPPAIAASTPVAPPSEAANPDVPAASPPPSTTKPTPKTPKTTFTLAPIAPVG